LQSSLTGLVGSTELVHALLANDLVDAMSIFTV
jgi:hypothetical protein